MSRRTRRTHSSSFKAKVALAAIRGDPHAGQTRRTLRSASEPDTVVEEAAYRECRGGVRSKPQRSRRTRREDQGAAREDRGVVDGEGLFIEGARSRPIAERRARIDCAHTLPVVRQCRFPALNRFTAYARTREGKIIAEPLGWVPERRWPVPWTRMYSADPWSTRTNTGRIEPHQTRQRCTK